jgi:hypothetical protein
MLDAMIAANKPKDGSESPADKTVPEKPPAEGQKPNVEGEDAPPPFHKHPRWQRMVRERDDLRKRIGEFEQKAATLDGFVGRLKSAGLSRDEFNAGMNIMALMKSDPEAAYQAIAPYVATLLQATGRVLPEDLRKQVDDGLISEDNAMEVSRLRARNAHHTARRDVDTKAAREAAAGEFKRSIETAIGEWEADWRKSDPDAERKKARVEDRALRIMTTEGGPRTPAEARKIAQRALEEINEEIRASVPRPQANRALPHAPSAGTATAAPRPKNMLDAMRTAYST